MDDSKVKEEVERAAKSEKELFQLKRVKAEVPNFVKDGKIGIMFARRVPWADLYITQEQLETLINEQISTAEADSKLDESKIK